MSYRERLLTLAHPMENDWQHHKEGLTKKYTFENRRCIAAFLNRLMAYANQVNHHPDVHTYETSVTVNWVTHQEGDTVTDKDRMAAAVSDQIAEEKEVVSLRFDMPDIADVSFPTMVGAIDTTKKKRRRKVKYKGVSLGRQPMKFEALVLSLAEIPLRLDGAVHALLNGASLFTVMDDIARYGESEVQHELVRQGAPTHLLQRASMRLNVQDIVEKEMVQLAQDRADAIALAERRLSKKRLGAKRHATLLKAITDFHEPGIFKRHANRLVNEAFAYGRSLTIQSYRRPHDRTISLADIVTVDAVIQTAVMDTNTCDECDDVDGEVMDFDSARQNELHPPYVLCLGGDRCRCVQIALLSDGTEVEVDELEDDAEAT